MKIVSPASLGATLDALNEAFFYSQPLTKSQRLRAAEWIAGRCGKPDSYAGMPAPTKKEVTEGAYLFTGEKLRTAASTRHVLGEEACRAMILLGVSTPTVRDALKAATSGMMHRLDQNAASGGQPGMYCCGTCSVALWRHLSAGGLEDAESRLVAGMKALKAHRQGDGRWRRFPFYYTLLALGGIDQPSAAAEIRYAAPVCERYLARPAYSQPFSQRRRLLLERILAKC